MLTVVKFSATFGRQIPMGERATYIFRENSSKLTK